MNVCLPALKNTRLSFLQQILSEEKQVLYGNELKNRSIKDSWEEFSVKRCWPLVKSNEEFCKYMPSNEMN